MNENIEKLESAFNTIIFSGGEDRSIAPNRQAFEQLKEILNTIFPTYSINYILITNLF